MAGLLTMAPPMAPTSTPQISNGSTTSNGPNFGPRAPPSNSTLLFGFLVSFLVLFIIFMIGGLGSRHYLDLRRRERRLLEASLEEENNPSESQSPALWDVSIVPGEKERWNELMPLSVGIQSDMDALKESDNTEALRARQTLVYIAQLSVSDRFFYTCGEFLQRMFTTLRQRSSGRRFDLEASHQGSTMPQTKADSEKKDDIEANLQISVLVAMPSPHRRQQQGRNDMTKLTKEDYDIEEIQDDGLLPDIAIGVTRVSWDKGRINIG